MEKIYIAIILVLSFCASAFTQTTESWDCIDSGNLTCDEAWTELGDVDGWAIVSNQVDWTAGGVSAFVDCEVRMDVDMLTDDHYAQATLVAGGTGSNIRNCGVMVRRTSTATDTYYCVVARWAVPDYELFKVVAGTFTSIATGGTPNATDVLRLEANGTTQTSKENGSATGMPSGTDTGITGNVRTGIFGERGSGTTGTDMTMDDFSANDLQVGGGTPASPKKGKPFIFGYNHLIKVGIQ